MNDRQYQRLAVRIFADFSVSIAVPAVLAALLGKWLDARYGTAPWLLISCLVVALFLTGAMVYRKAKAYGKEYSALDKKNEPPL